MGFQQSTDKYPEERFSVSVSFINRIPATESLNNTSEVKIISQEGNDLTSSMLLVTQVSNPKILATVQGGDGGQSYFVKFIARTGNPNTVLEEVVILNVLR